MIIIKKCALAGGVHHLGEVAGGDHHHHLFPGAESVTMAGRGSGYAGNSTGDQFANTFVNFDKYI